MHEKLMPELPPDFGMTPARIAADLCWAVRSPPLLRSHSSGGENMSAMPSYPDADFFAQAWRQWPAPDINESECAAVGRQRLGIYFEHLWQCWWRGHPQWQVLARNLPIRENGITLGELDVVLRNLDTAQIEHWELAVKFYLGIGDWSQPEHWLGPNQRDTLARKWRHLDAQQARLSRHPAAVLALNTLGISAIDKVRVIVKGRLFYPLEDFRAGRRAMFAGPTHECGFWARLAELQEWQRDEVGDAAGSSPWRYRRIHGAEMLAPLPSCAASDLQDVTALADDGARLLGDGAFDHALRPQALALFKAQLDGEHWQEFARGFIVSESWLALALAR